MTRQYSIAEARAHLPSIIDDVEAGNEIELTRRGKPVAMVISRREYARLRSDRPGFGKRYDEFVARFGAAANGDDAFRDVRDREQGRVVDL